MIEPLDIENLDGFGNMEYKHANDLELLEKQVYFMEDKLNEVIETVNRLTNPEKGKSNE